MGVNEPEAEGQADPREPSYPIPSKSALIRTKSHTSNVFKLAFSAG